jgi:hypothetical protein
MESAWGLAMLPYIAGSHRLAEKFVCCHFGDSFRHLPFVHGDSLANQFDGSFLIGFICKEIPHNSRSSLGIESRNPHVPACCHLRAVYLPAVNPIADLFNWRLRPRYHHPRRSCCQRWRRGSIRPARWKHISASYRLLSRHSWTDISS